MFNAWIPFPLLFWLLQINNEPQENCLPIFLWWPHSSSKLHTKLNASYKFNAIFRHFHHVLKTALMFSSQGFVVFVAMIGGLIEIVEKSGGANYLSQHITKLARTATFLLFWWFCRYCGLSGVILTCSCSCSYCMLHVNSISILSKYHFRVCFNVDFNFFVVQSYETKLIT